MDVLSNSLFSLYLFHFPTKTGNILALMQQNKVQMVHIRCVIDTLSVYFIIPLYPVYRTMGYVVCLLINQQND